jgi:predicted Zn-dependent protease
MKDELQRSIDSLAIEGLTKPYYLEYTLRYRWTSRATAAFGAIVDSGMSQTARLTVGVRVGSPARDNTNFFDAALFFFGGAEQEEPYRNRSIPLELRYSVLRRQLWLATDAAYKAALEQYAKKEAVLKNRVQRDTTPDFVPLQPEALADTSRPLPHVSLPAIAKHLEEISAIARNYPALQQATITFEHLPELVLYVNSEGRNAIMLRRQVGIEIVASGQAADGMPLAQTYAVYAPTVEELPPWDSLARAMHAVAMRLSEQVRAPAIDEPYSGPVLVRGQAAAELIAQVFAPNLVAQRPALSEQGVQQMERFTAFQNKIGARVMAEFLTVESTPNPTTISGVPVAAAYRIDDQGIQAEPLVLVRRGYLEHLLSSRTPTRRVRQSNGRARGGEAMYDVIVLRSDDRRRIASDEQLLEQMQRILKRRDLPYGYIVSEILNQNLLYTALYRQTGGTFPTGSDNQLPVLTVERVWRDGRRERVRGLSLSAGGYQLFRDVVAVGRSTYVHNLLAPAVISPFQTAGSQYVVATIATPDLLFEDVELRPIEDGFPKPPLLPSPIAGHSSNGK